MPEFNVYTSAECGSGFCVYSDNKDPYEKEGINEYGVPWIEKSLKLFRVGQHRKGDRDWSTDDLKTMKSSFHPPIDNKWSVPIQKDHADGCDDTIGWPVQVFNNADDTETYAVAHFSGQDAVNKVKAGLYRLFSVSVYTKPVPGIIREMSVTPFPQLGDTEFFKRTKSNELIQPIESTQSTTQNNSNKGGHPMPEETKTTTEAGASILTHPLVVAQFAAFTSRMDNLEKKNTDLEKKNEDFSNVLAYKEAETTINNYAQEGFSTPAMAKEEIKLYVTLTPPQRELFNNIKKLGGKVVDFTTRGDINNTKPGNSSATNTESVEFKSDVAKMLGTVGLKPKAKA